VSTCRRGSKDGSLCGEQGVLVWVVTEQAFLSNSTITALGIYPISLFTVLGIFRKVSAILVEGVITALGTFTNGLRYLY